MFKLPTIQIIYLDEQKYFQHDSFDSFLAIGTCKKKVCLLYVNVPLSQ